MTKKASAALVPVDHIAHSILVLRGHRIITDRDLAAIYGVSTGRLNEAVKRNAKRFPEDFMFELTAEESEHSRSHFAISSWGGRRYLRRVFTEHGAIQAANALNSDRSLDRDYEEQLVELGASGDLRPERWVGMGPRFFMAGLAVMLASDGDRRGLLDLAERLHPGATEVSVFNRWLERSPLRPSRFLPLVDTARRKLSATRPGCRDR